MGLCALGITLSLAARAPLLPKIAGDNIRVENPVDSVRNLQRRGNRLLCVQPLESWGQILSIPLHSHIVPVCLIAAKLREQ